jgi:hypothetical protein
MYSNYKDTLIGHSRNFNAIIAHLKFKQTFAKSVKISLFHQTKKTPFCPPFCPTRRRVGDSLAFLHLETTGCQEQDTIYRTRLNSHK